MQHKILKSAAATLCVFALGACGSDASNSLPKQNIVKSRIKTSGRAALQKQFPDLAKGPIDCDPPKMDDKAKVATYVCIAETDAGVQIKLSGSSTYDQLKNKTKGAVFGTIAITADGKEVLTTDCVGKGCPEK